MNSLPEIQRMMASSDLALCSLLSAFANSLGMPEDEAVEKALAFVPEFRRFVADQKEADRG